MTRADLVPAARDEDTQLIGRLRAALAKANKQLADVMDDRDSLLLAIARITAAAGLPEGYEIDKLVAHIEAMVAR